MSKFLGAVFLVAALAHCEAGFLEVLGGKTEQFGKTIHKGTIQVEEQLSGLLGSRRTQPEVPPVPTSSSSATASASASASSNSQGPQQFQQKPLPTFLPNFKPPVPPPRPQQQQPPQQQQKQAPPQNAGTSTVMDDYDFEPIKIFGPEVPDQKSSVPMAKTAVEMDKDTRTQVMGAAWCGPEETFERGACRPT